MTSFLWLNGPVSSPVGAYSIHPGAKKEKQAVLELGVFGGFQAVVECLRRRMPGNVPGIILKTHIDYTPGLWENQDITKKERTILCI